MKLPTSMNKWVPVVLGVVSALLVANLVTEYRGMQPGNAKVQHVRATTPVARTAAVGAKGSSHPADDLAKYDPTVHFAALKAQDSRPLPDEDRNPFQFVGEVAPVAQRAAPPPPNVTPPPPPAPPPPPPLKAMGYNELPGGKKEAMVTYNDDLQVVHEGDVIGTRFKVVTISPATVVVEDEKDHKTIELPFPQ